MPNRGSHGRSDGVVDGSKPSGQAFPALLTQLKALHFV